MIKIYYLNQSTFGTDKMPKEVELEGTPGVKIHIIVCFLAPKGAQEVHM